jgi:hypothetical protein
VRGLNGRDDAQRSTQSATLDKRRRGPGLKLAGQAWHYHLRYHVLLARSSVAPLPLPLVLRVVRGLRHVNYVVDYPQSIPYVPLARSLVYRP